MLELVYLQTFVQKYDNMCTIQKRKKCTYITKENIHSWSLNSYRDLVDLVIVPEV